MRMLHRLCCRLFCRDLYKIVRFCDELGWHVDCSTPDLIYFCVPEGGIQPYIFVEKDEPESVFFAPGAWKLEKSERACQFLSHFLDRPSGSNPFWQTPEYDNEIHFVLYHRAPLEGLTLSDFQSICEAMMEEITNFHAKLKEWDLYFLPPRTPKP